MLELKTQDAVVTAVDRASEVCSRRVPRGVLNCAALWRDGLGRIPSAVPRSRPVLFASAMAMSVATFVSYALPFIHEPVRRGAATMRRVCGVSFSLTPA